MSHPGRLRHRVGQAIVEHELWSPGDRVAVAVSGGLDSMCLLSVLHATMGLHGAVLSVVSVDHGVREGSRADAAFVNDTATTLGLPCRVCSLELGAEASEGQMRSARYAAFRSLGTDRVALAHHADDQAETLLLHAIRGTGTTGLAAMSWRRGGFVRPLLGERRAALEAWVAQYGVDYRDDPSNQDRRFLRNRLRHEVLPALEAARPGAIGALARSARHAAADDALLDALLDEALQEVRGPDLPVSWVCRQPEPLVRRALLRRWPRLTTHQIGAVVRAAERGRGRVEVGDGIAIEIGPREGGSGSVVGEG